MTNLADLVGAIARQALNNSSTNQNNQQQQTDQTNSGFGSILGSVLGQLNKNSTPQNDTQNTANNSDLNSIFGSVLNQILNANKSQSGGIKTAILLAVIPLILNWIQKQGGLQQALEKLKNAGMSSQVNNWVDPNQTNAPAPVEAVEPLFNDQEVEQVAQEAQTTKKNVYSTIASVLPQVIDALTPQGQQTNQQEANSDIQNVLSLVSQILKR